MDSRLEAGLVVEAIREFAETLVPRDREPLMKFARYVEGQEFFREYERQEKQRELDRERWKAGVSESDPAERLRRQLRGQAS